MAKEIVSDNLGKSRGEIESGVAKLNAAFKKDKRSELAVELNKMDTMLKNYRKLSKVTVYAELLEEKDPMKAAILRRTYDALAVNPTFVEKTFTDEKGVEAKSKVQTGYVLEDIKALIEIDAFETWCEMKSETKPSRVIAIDNNWSCWAEHLGMFMTKRVFDELGKDSKRISERYKLSKRAADLKRDAVPESNTQLLKYLQKIVSGMIGEDYRVRSQDVAWMLNGMCKYNRNTDTLAAPTSKTIITLVTSVCYHLLAKSAYDVFYREYTDDELKKLASPVEVSKAASSKAATKKAA